MLFPHRFFIAAYRLHRRCCGFFRLARAKLETSNSYSLAFSKRSIRSSFESSVHVKVLFVLSLGKLDGGAALVWMNLLDGLRTRGVEPYVVIPKDADGSLTSELDRRNIPWRAIFYTWWVTSSSNETTPLRRVRRMGGKLINRSTDRQIGAYMEECGIELVYICDGTITAGLHEAKRRGIPVVWHIHEFIRDTPGGVKFSDPEAHVGSTLALADAIITVTRSIKTDLRTRFPMLQNIHVVYNGIPKSRIFDKPVRPEGKTVVFTLVGRIDENKGQEDAIRAFIRIAPKYPNAVLRIVGTGDPKLTERLKVLADRGAAHGCIEFLGYRKDIPIIWRDTDIALNCSYSEGCSMVLCEAMSSGCLMLCSTAESNVELIDGKYGVLYERTKVADLAEKMAWVIDHPDECQKLALAGKRRAQRIFDLDRQIDLVYQIFTEVLK